MAGRLAVYAVLTAALTAGAVSSIAKLGLYGVVRERGPVEIVQLLSLALGAVVLVWGGRRRSAPALHVLALMLLAAITRELDTLFNMSVGRDSWKIALAAVGALLLFYAWRRRRELLDGLDLEDVGAAAGLLFSGILMVMVFSRLAGQQSAWEVGLGDAYVRWVPRLIEELCEMLGYLLILFGSIEALAAPVTRPSVRPETSR